MSDPKVRYVPTGSLPRFVLQSGASCVLFPGG
jgi:hypothetical protein